MIVGAYGDDTKAPNGGLARVYSGRDGRVLHDFYGTVPQGRFGSAVGGAGDVDGDGQRLLPDLP